VFPVRYELGSYIPEDDILQDNLVHVHRKKIWGGDKVNALLGEQEVSGICKASDTPGSNQYTASRFPTFLSFFLTTYSIGYSIQRRITG
jgi:hypothetical protein